jgi:hypothetical protein
MKRMPVYIDENHLRKILCPKCKGTTKVFSYAAVPEVIVCQTCKIGWDLNIETRYRTKRILGQEINEFMEWHK